MNTEAKVIAGFLIGAAIGMVTGLMIAPTTGNTARKNLNRKAKKLVRKLEGYMGIQHKTGRKTKSTTTAARRAKAVTV